MLDHLTLPHLIISISTDQISMGVRCEQSARREHEAVRLDSLDYILEMELSASSKAKPKFNIFARIKNTNLSFRIKIEHFEGPFDLLLFFIERDELDINDIPIAKITKDFLEHIRHLENLNIDVASEFIVVAATLMRIKAKMLLPRKEKDEDGEEIDPRRDLVQRLLEYKRFKEVLDEFAQMEELQSKRLPRGNVGQEIKTIAQKALVDVELESVSLYKLMQVFNRLLDNLQQQSEKVVHRIFDYDYTIEDQSELIYTKIQSGKRLDFTELFAAVENRVHAIVTFLALLEMVSQQRVRLTLGEGVNNFWISAREEDEEEE